MKIDKSQELTDEDIYESDEEENKDPNYAPSQINEEDN